MLEAWLLVTYCCFQGHATAPTHHIGRLCKRLALFLLVRGELSGVLNPKLSVGGLFRRVLERKSNFCTSREEKLRVPTATNKGTRRICTELRTVASN